MNILLWSLQALLALHTTMGAVWKWSHSATETMPSLGAIPNGAWISLSGLEFLLCICLVLPAFRKSLANLAPVAALCIAGEMLLFTIIHLLSSPQDLSSVFYWMTVLAVCIFIAYGRFYLKPIRIEDAVERVQV